MTPVGKSLFPLTDLAPVPQKLNENLQITNHYTWMQRTLSLKDSNLKVVELRHLYLVFVKQLNQETLSLMNTWIYTGIIVVLSSDRQSPNLSNYK
jgi:hypothetical protein